MAHVNANRCAVASAVDIVTGVNSFNITDGWTCAHTTSSSGCSEAVNVLPLPAVSQVTPLVIQAYGLHSSDSFSCKLSWLHDSEDGSGAAISAGDQQLVYLRASNVSRTSLTCHVPILRFPSVQLRVCVLSGVCLVGCVTSCEMWRVPVALCDHCGLNVWRAVHL